MNYTKDLALCLKRLGIPMSKNPIQTRIDIEDKLDIYHRKLLYPTNHEVVNTTEYSVVQKAYNLFMEEYNKN
jgi:hypothetical protein